MRSTMSNATMNKCRAINHEQKHVGINLRQSIQTIRNNHELHQQNDQASTQHITTRREKTKPSNDQRQPLTQSKTKWKTTQGNQWQSLLNRKPMKTRSTIHQQRKNSSTKQKMSAQSFEQTSINHRPPSHKTRTRLEINQIAINIISEKLINQHWGKNQRKGYLMKPKTTLWIASLILNDPQNILWCQTHELFWTELGTRDRGLWAVAYNAKAPNLYALRQFCQGSSKRAVSKQQ